MLLVRTVPVPSTLSLRRNPLKTHTNKHNSSPIAAIYHLFFYRWPVFSPTHPSRKAVPTLLRVCVNYCNTQTERGVRAFGRPRKSSRLRQYGTSFFVRRKGAKRGGVRALWTPSSRWVGPSGRSQLRADAYGAQPRHHLAN